MVVVVVAVMGGHLLGCGDHLKVHVNMGQTASAGRTRRLVVRGLVVEGLELPLLA